MLQMLSQAGILALLSLIVGLVPIGFGLAYAIRPSEQRLALMRPISLAAIFAGLSGSLSGGINTLQMMWVMQPPPTSSLLAVGLAEALVPMLVAFTALTIAWLCAVVGLGRHP